MSSDAKGPVLDLPLDALPLVDASGNGHTVTSANVTLRADPMLGACIEMSNDGAGINVAAAPDLAIVGDLTVACWVYPLELNDANNDRPWFRILGKGGFNHTQDYSLWANPLGGVLVFGAAGQASFTLPGGTMTVGRWLHLTGVRRGDQMILYVDGQAVSTTTTGASLTASGGSLHLGIAAGFQKPFLRLAKARVFDRGLSADEVWQMYTGDQALPFRGSFPISFDLENEDGESVLYMDDLPGGPTHSLSVALGNLSGRTVYLLATEDSTPSVADHHFELRFRPGTLNLMLGASMTLVDASDWAMSAPVVNADRTVSIYLLCTSAGATLAASAQVTVTLSGIIAASAGGSRATRVELRYGAIAFDAQGKAPLVGSRTRVLNIVNERGKKHSPLHLGAGRAQVIVGGDTVLADHRILNDGLTPNAVALRLTNTSRDTAIILQGGSNGSLLIVTFDVGTDEGGVDTPWALGSADQIAKCSFATAPEGLQITQPDKAVPRWVITPKGDTFPLAALASVELTILGIVTQYPRGVTNVYLRYENVNGYWDRTLVCPLEKSPMLFDDAIASVDTGQGAALLDFNGSLQLRGTEVSLSGTLPAQPTGPSDFSARLALQASPVNVNNVVTTALVQNPTPGAMAFSTVMIGGTSFTPQVGYTMVNGIDTKLFEQPPTLLVHGGIRAKGGQPAGLGANDVGYAFHGNNGDSDSGMFSDGDGLLELYTNAAERMRIDPSGNVGIGTTGPRAPLEVAGSLLAADGYMDTMYLPRPTTAYGKPLTPDYGANLTLDGATGDIGTLGAIAAQGSIMTQGSVTASKGTVSAANLTTAGLLTMAGTTSFRQSLAGWVRMDGSGNQTWSSNINADYGNEHSNAWHVSFTSSNGGTPFEYTPIIIANYTNNEGNWDQDVNSNPIIVYLSTNGEFYMRVATTRAHTIFFVAIEILDENTNGSNI